jgi:hypothetical protein
LLIHHILAYSSIVCGNYPSDLVDRAPQNHKQPLELVYWLLRCSIFGRL